MLSFSTRPVPSLRRKQRHGCRNCAGPDRARKAREGCQAMCPDNLCRYDRCSPKRGGCPAPDAAGKPASFRIQSRSNPKAHHRCRSPIPPSFNEPRICSPRAPSRASRRPPAQISPSRIYTARSPGMAVRLSLRLDRCASTVIWVGSGSPFVKTVFPSLAGAPLARSPSIARHPAFREAQGGRASTSIQETAAHGRPWGTIQSPRAYSAGNALRLAPLGSADGRSAKGANDGFSDWRR